MTDTSYVLVACSDPQNRQHLARILAQCGLEAVFSSTVSEARAILAQHPLLLVFCDDALTGGGFSEILGETERSAPKVPVVVVSRHGEWEQYLKAMHRGAFDYIARPCPSSEVQRIVSKALRVVSLTP